MPRRGATFDENDGRTRTPSSSPPYALRKGEKDLSLLTRGTRCLLRHGVRADIEAGRDAGAPGIFKGVAG
jgi:hypothetical protein